MAYEADQILAAHLGDLHGGLRGRREQVRRSMVFLLEDLRRVQPDVILQAGDIFDTRSSIDDRNFFADWLAEAADIAPFVAVRGNHDVPGDLQIFNRVAAAHLIRIWEQPAFHRGAGLLVLGLPHQEKGGLVTAGSITESDRASESSIRAYLATEFCREADAFDGPVILIAHADVHGRVTSNRESRPQQGIALSVDDLLASGADYVALGHIHKLQKLHQRVAYAGSVARANFGEEPDEKGYLLVTLGPKGALPQIETRPIPCRPMVTITSTWTDDGWDTRGAEDLPEDAEIRVRLSAPEDHATDLAAAQAEVLDRFPEAQVEAEVIPADRRRSEAIAFAETPEDMLRAYWDASETPATEFQGVALAALGLILKEIAA